MSNVQPHTVLQLVVLNIDLHAPNFRSSLLGNAAGVKFRWAFAAKQFGIFDEHFSTRKSCVHMSNVQPHTVLQLVVLNIDLHAPNFRSSLLGNAAGVK